MSSTDWFHLLLSILTVVVMALAALQAVLLAIQEHWLRKNPSGSFMCRLPPLITSEKWLFYLLGMGFVLLNILLVSSFIAFHHVLFVDKWLLSKTIVAVGAWIVFAWLLVSRHVYGLRGRLAIYSTFFGVMLLVVVYCASNILIG